ncbi:hypothetical protein CDEST_12590 [Colletotrichum destructivum]|uniref:Uncharacterized protein n=1 Tax=Colletotrichum destructivum TaxID=34406 RepID=A0AAX4IX12_9PEZI|nr:hypothetical protein CDEST_12590 [Colletotrichum destructivum]
MASTPADTGFRQRRKTLPIGPSQTFSMTSFSSQHVKHVPLGDRGPDYLRIPPAVSGETDDETLSGQSQHRRSESINKKDIQDQDNISLLPTEQSNHSTTDNATATPSTHDESGRSVIHWSMYSSGWIIHLLAVSMTIVVLVIGMKKIYWYPEAGPLIHGDYCLDAETISNVLQLVAKIHELLIVASLSSIALAMFRRRLIKDGVRLGFLTGSYRVGDVGYLGTAAFWRQGLSDPKPWEILLSGFLVFATIMSTIVGPASAVLLLPTLDWYKFKPGTEFNNIKLPLYYGRHPNRAWTETYQDSDDLKNARCNTVDGIYTTGCPAGGFNEISTWVQNHGATQLRNNLTFSATSADIRRHVVFTQANFSENGAKTTLSTTAPQFILDSVGLFQRYINDRNRTVGAVSRESRLRLNFTRTTGSETAQNHSLTELYQPFVQSRCEVHDWDQMSNSTENVTYPTTVNQFQCFNQSECLDQNVHLVSDTTVQYIKQYEKSSAVSNYWTSQDNSTIIFLHGTVPNKTSENGDQIQTVYFCTLTANWVPSSFSTDPGVSDVLNSTLSHGSSMENVYHNKSVQSVLPMRFSSSWFEYANPWWNSENNTTALARVVDSFARHETKNDTIQGYMAFGDSGNMSAVEGLLERVFGGYLTDALARDSHGRRTRVVLSENNSELTFVDLQEQYSDRGGIHKYISHPRNITLDKWGGNETTIHKSFDKVVEDLKKGLAIDIQAERYGYGTGQQRKTASFAQAMLFIYLGAITIYAATIVVSKALEYLEGKKPGVDQSVIPWADLQDLFVLGLRTPPPGGDDLASSGVGVSDIRIWQKVIAARVGDDNKVQLAFEKTSLEKLDPSNAGEYC